MCVDVMPSLAPLSVGTVSAIAGSYLSHATHRRAASRAGLLAKGAPESSH